MAFAPISNSTFLEFTGYGIADQNQTVSVAYGFSNSYVRGDGGFRLTATDVDNPDFNVYLGMRYRTGSKDAVRPAEWAPDAGFGWKPNPKQWPNIVLGADAGYGLQSNRVLTYVAVRYLLGGAR